MPVVIVLLVLIILAELFLLMLRCRREHPGWAAKSFSPCFGNAAGATAPGACCGCSATPTGATTTSPIFRKTPWRPSAVPLNTATVLSWTSI